MITTLETMAQQSPELLRNSIDERIVKVRPMSTPVDQLSRCGRARRAGSMTVEYYSVDTKKTEAKLAEAHPGGAGSKKSDDLYTYILKTTDDSLFEISETILVPSQPGYDRNGRPSGALMLYVVDRPSGGGVEVAPVNARETEIMGGKTLQMPSLQVGELLVRMARAATELDVQTAQFAALPQKASNNCQIFKMQVEQSGQDRR